MLPQSELNKIVEIKQAVEAELLNRPGVTGVDVGFKYVNGQKTGQIAIRVLVEEKKDVPAKQRIPRQIEGVVTDVIEETIIPYTSVAPSEVGEAQVDVAHYDPLVGGISVGPCGNVSAGTLGTVVYDNVSNAAMLLTNFHVVSVNGNGGIGEMIAQPGRFDGGVCLADVIARTERSVLNGDVDGAVATLTARKHRCTITEIGNPNGTTTASLGMAVRKRGRTTGLTYGTVDGVAATVNVDYGPGIGVRTLNNQISIAPDTNQNVRFSDRGDSGSLIVDGSIRAVGLLFAGSSVGFRTFANPIAAVLSVLNVRLCQAVETPKLKPELIEVKLRKDSLPWEKPPRWENIKSLKREKPEIKEILEGPKSPKELVENPGRPPVDLPANGNGDVDSPLARLKQSIEMLSHFIPAELRPDLSAGALMDEADVDMTDLSRWLDQNASDAKWMKDYKDLEKYRREV